MPDGPAILLTLLEVLTALAIAGAATLGLRGARTLDRRAQLGVLALFVVGLALRLYAPASPHDINFRGWGAYSGGTLEIERGYGLPALGRLLHPFIVGWDRDDGWLFNLVAVVGALAPVALLAWLLVAEASPTLAWGAAVLMCSATPHVRFSHTDAQQLPSLTFALVGLAAWAEHARRPSWFAAITAGAALTAAACGRIECLAVAAAVGLVSLVDRAGVPWRHRATWTAILGTAAVAAWHLDMMLRSNPSWDASIYAQSGLQLITGHPLAQVGYRHLILLDPAFTPAPLAALIVAGLFIGRLPVRTRVALAVSAFGLCVIVPTWSPYGAEAYAIARYQIAALPFALTLAASAVDAIAARLPQVGARAALLVAMTVVGAWRLPLDFQPSTMGEEYAFIRGELPKLPPNCVLLYDEWQMDTGLAFPTHLIDMMRLPLRAVATGGAAPDPSACTIYYRAATCSSVADPASPVPAITATCAGPGPGVTLTPIAEADLPRRQWVYDFYATDPVKVAFYRVNVDLRDGRAGQPPAEGPPRQGPK